jgi:cell division protein FtsI/penicillin-binding protein 2
MAKKFKIGEKILDLSWEKKGNIPGFKNTYADTLNISIGQGDVLITPVQACFLSCVIANDGISKKVNVVNSVVDENGKELFGFKSNKKEKVTEKSTAELIGQMMRGCVENGTGKSADSELVNISGKTGTAESGWMEDGKSMVHGWFTGFFPSENPKYAISVILENGKTSKNAAIVFKNIAEKIIEINKLN